MIKVTIHTPRSLSWWHAQYKRDRIDIAPPYQRRSYIWSRWKQAHLVDSVLNDFDVPKFYVADFLEMPSKLNESRRPYAIIDGKQRLLALFDFLEDKLELNKTSTLYDDPDMKIGGLTYSDLQSHYPHLAEKLDKFMPTVMSVAADRAELIDELFVRLNSGEATTGAERRNAMAGPVPMIVRELVLHPFFQKKIRFSIQRMQDHNLGAKLLLIESKGGFVDTKASDLDKFTSEAAKATSKRVELEQARDRIFKTLERMSPIFSDRDRQLAAQGHVPVYYWIVRKQPKLLSSFHAFLQRFNDDVKEAVRLSRTSRPGRADPELLNYYTLGRSTNDQASLQGRYDIMLGRLQKFAHEE